MIGGDAQPIVDDEEMNLRNLPNLDFMGKLWVSNPKPI